jgi:hypothetical protein
MQALKSFFSRTQAPQAAAHVQQPAELSADSLKLVAGGMPRVSRVAPASNTVDETSLPRVS